jgi:hypothetical protein
MWVIGRRRFAGDTAVRQNKQPAAPFPLFADEDFQPWPATKPPTIRANAAKKRQA